MLSYFLVAGGFFALGYFLCGIRCAMAARYNPSSDEDDGQDSGV